MSIINNGLLLAAEGAAAGGYEISRSLRFNGNADSAYLTRTPGSAGSRTTWTWSAWVKRSNLAPPGYQSLFTSTTSGNETLLYFDTSNQLNFYNYSGGYLARKITTAVFRDPSAWYHIVLTWDTTNGTAADRVRIYINGVRETTFGTSTDAGSSEQSTINNTIAHMLGSYGGYSNNFFDGYLADVIFVDGSALDPTSFGEFDATTGVWNPVAFSGSYGTNGFRLTFSDNSGTTSTTLGKDAAGSNNWTPNNFSVASGSGNDSLVDVPTASGTDTGTGGEVRGNYCTWNPLTNGSYNTLSNGNLDVTGNTNANNGNTRSTIAFKTGKWYSEMTVSATAASVYPTLGIILAEDATTPQNAGLPGQVGYPTNSVAYELSGVKRIANSTSSYGSSYTTGDVIGIAVDADNGAVYFSKNGTWQNSGDPTSGASKTGAAFTWTGGSLEYVFGTAQYNGSKSSQNWGQHPFAYTAPSGFKALCTTNLPTPTIADGSTAMDVKLYTGNSSTQTISGLGFSPDFVWLKKRSGIADHYLYDTVRGATYRLYSNTTDAESTSSTGLTAFTSTGFDLGSANDVNQSSNTYVAWTWDAGSSTVTNTSGSISSQVRANASAGFSIVTYNSGATTGNYSVGHGLNAAPTFIIHKTRSSGNWWVYHASVIDNLAKYLQLNSTNAIATNSANMWGGAFPTSSVFGVRVGDLIGTSQDAIAYCFTPVASYSSFGSYVGNGSSDGPFVYTGHRSRWIMVKRTDSAIDWIVIDTARSDYNQARAELYPNDSAAEGTNGGPVDINSNGFKVRTNSSSWNASGGTYIFASFASHPFQTARAR